MSKNFGALLLVNNYCICLQGEDCCSTSIVSFHYITPNQMYMFDFLFYHVKVMTTHSGELPRKLDFEEIKLRLKETTPTTTVPPPKETTEDSFVYS